jgi:hypothetical protein
VLLGRPDGRYERSVPAKTISYTDAKSNQIVYAFHASLRGLRPDGEYVYAALHDGAEPVLATFRTAPRGRVKFAFTGFGDQGTPTLGKRYVLPAGVKTYFSVPPASGQTDVTRGLWYSFTVGSVQVISLANDDICYQDGGNSYVRGYSRGAQKAWLEKELATARGDRGVDWVVVCMHQVAISTADQFNGADLAIREEWVPLFDRYGVDLVVGGHEHHYERSHPIRGAAATATRTPLPAATRADVVDTSKGTVHMVLGGGTSAPSNQLFFTPPRCRVITAAGAPDPATGKRPPV